MKFYSYVISRDYGFAPNPHFGYCTLATCKQRIRKSAQIGDWIGAFGAASMKIREKLVVLMLVEEILTFDEYWEDSRFVNKRPVFNKSVMFMYGDNIYHHLGNEWTQEPSHHSEKNGNINYLNLNRDTQADRVLIAREFFYFGNNAIEMPAEFDSLIWRNIGYKICNNEILVGRFIEYVRQRFDKGIHGTPYSRENGKFVHYGGK